MQRPPKPRHHHPRSGEGSEAIAGPSRNDPAELSHVQEGKPDARIIAARAVWKDGVLEAEGAPPGDRGREPQGGLRSRDLQNEVVTMFRTNALSRRTAAQDEAYRPGGVARGNQLIADRDRARGNRTDDQARAQHPSGTALPATCS